MSKGRLWGGRVLSAIPVLMLLFSGVMKIMGGPALAEGMGHLGWPVALAIPLAVMEIGCTLLYIFPRTAVLGAILLTGYLGGAMATHMRLGEAYIIQFLLGAMLWGGLYLRDARLRALLPLTSQPA